MIVVDDGSTDDTRAVVERYGDQVSYERQGNAGGAAARTRGAELAPTEWIAFLDSDDIWLPNHLESLTGVSVATGGLAHLCFADVKRSEGEGGGTMFEAAGLRFDGPYHLRTDAVEWVVAGHQLAMIQSMPIRQQMFRDLAGAVQPA